MRIAVEFEFSDREIPKDKNKIFASWMKYFMNLYDSNMYKKLYESGAVQKNYTFAVYLGKNVIFNRDSITIDSCFVKFYFSCYDIQESLNFYNIFKRSLNKEYEYKNIKIIARKMSVLKNEVFTENYAYFKTMSPIIIREHLERDNNSNFYHDISTDDGKKILMVNIKSRLLKQFGENVLNDTNALYIEVISSKSVTVRHNEINIPSNLCVLKINAKPYILEYIYLSGKISSLNASGYGMLTLLL